MILGTTIIYNGTATDYYYSPAFPRGGNSALLSVDVTHKKGGGTLVITVEHKNRDDLTWSSLGAFTGITATGLATKDLSGFKELARFRYEFTSGAGGDFFHLMVLAPAWRPN